MNTVTSNRDFWIGGSDIPAIMEKSSFSSKYELIESKLNPTERQGEQFLQKYIDFGNHMEPIIREYINNELDTNYKPAHKEDNAQRIRGNVDGFDKDAPIPLLEIKTYGGTARMEEYELQVQLYMYLFDVQQCLLVGYKREEETEDFSFNDFKMEFDESNITQVIINRDDNLIDEIMEKVNSFVEELDFCKTQLQETGEIPSQMELLMASESSPLVDVINEYESVTQALAEMKELKKKETDIRNELLKLMQQYDIKKIDNDDLVITVKEPHTRQSLDTKRFKEEQPELFDQYKKETVVKESLAIKIKG